MNERGKRFVMAHVRVERSRLTLHVEVPVRWVLVIVVAALIQLLPEFWQTIQVAISFVQ